MLGAEWFQWAVGRAAKLDPVPRGRKPVCTDFETEQELLEASRHHFGKAVPREALDPDSGFKPEQQQARLAALLERLNHKKNPFLRSPAQLKKLGFPGTPYQLVPSGGDRRKT